MSDVEPEYGVIRRIVLGLVQRYRCGAGDGNRTQFDRSGTRENALVTNAYEFVNSKFPANLGNFAPPFAPENAPSIIQKHPRFVKSANDALAAHPVFQSLRARAWSPIITRSGLSAHPRISSVAPPTSRTRSASLSKANAMET